MPELPEVETVRRVLLTEIINHKILNVDIRYNKIIEGDIDEFKNKLINNTFNNINRLGKYLIFNLNNINLISHLRMEGKYYYLKNHIEEDKHIHVIFYLDNGYMLEYKDVRKFGRMTLRTNEELYTTKPLNEVGLETLDLTNFPYIDVKNKINNSNNSIKTILLNQHIISGLGNIYVDEVLFASKVNPNRIGSSITLGEVKNIVTSSNKILLKAIEYKGTTIRTYTSSLGVSGAYQDFLLVHTKEYCPICNNKLEKMKINGRSTYFCKNCQR